MVLTFILTIAGCASTKNVGPEDTLKDASSLDAGATLRAANADAAWPASTWWRAQRSPTRRVGRTCAGRESDARAGRRTRARSAFADWRGASGSRAPSRWIACDRP